MHAGRAHLQFLLEDQVVKLAAEASKTDSSPALSERAGLSIPIDTINAQWKGHWRHVAARFDYAAGKVELYVDGRCARTGRDAPADRCGGRTGAAAEASGPLNQSGLPVNAHVWHGYAGACRKRPPRALANPCHEMMRK